MCAPGRRRTGAAPGAAAWPWRRRRLQLWQRLFWHCCPVPALLQLGWWHDTLRRHGGSCRPCLALGSLTHLQHRSFNVSQTNECMLDPPKNSDIGHFLGQSLHPRVRKETLADIT